MISVVKKLILSAKKQPIVLAKALIFANLRAKLCKVIINLKQDELENLVILL